MFHLPSHVMTKINKQYQPNIKIVSTKNCCPKERNKVGKKRGTVNEYMFKTYGYMIIVLTAKNLTHLLGKYINLVKEVHMSCLLTY